MAINYGGIGHNIGSGIGQGLKQLAEHKLNQKLRQQEEERNAEVFIRAGLDRDDALAIAKQPLEFQRMAFQKLEGLQFGGRNQQQQQQVQPQQQANPMQSLAGLGEPQQQPMPQQQVPEQSVQKALPKPEIEPVKSNKEAIKAEGRNVANLFKVGSGGAQPANKTESAAEIKSGIAKRDKFLTEETGKYKAVTNLAKEAKKTLDFLEENKKDLPGFPFNLVDQKYNPFGATSIRTLEAKYKKLIGDVATNSSKLSGFKSGQALLRLAGESKSAIDQPYETQKSILEDLIEAGSEAESLRKKLHKIKQDNGGKYPIDVQDQLEQFELNQEESDSGPNGPSYQQNGKYYLWNSKLGKYEEAELA